jgi:hypothetical protein
MAKGNRQAKPISDRPDCGDASTLLRCAAGYKACCKARLLRHLRPWVQSSVICLPVTHLTTATDNKSTGATPQRQIRYSTANLVYSYTVLVCPLACTCPPPSPVKRLVTTVLPLSAVRRSVGPSVPVRGTTPPTSMPLAPLRAGLEKVPRPPPTLTNRLGSPTCIAASCFSFLILIKAQVAVLPCCHSLCTPEVTIFRTCFRTSRPSVSDLNSLVR